MVPELRLGEPEMRPSPGNILTNALIVVLLDMRYGIDANNMTDVVPYTSRRPVRSYRDREAGITVGGVKTNDGMCDFH